MIPNLFSAPDRSGRAPTAKPGRQRRLAGLFVAVATATSAGVASAINWDGGGQTSEWIEPANWEFNVVPSGSQTATILNDVANITLGDVPTVFAVEVGLGPAPGGLNLAAGSGVAALRVTSNVAVAPGGVLSIGGSPGVSQLAAATMITAGSVSLLPRGTATLNGQLTQTAGTVTLNGGALNAATVFSQAGLLNAIGTINGNVQLGNGAGPVATLSPGANIGALAIDGDFRMASDARLAMQFRAIGPNGTFDTITISGAATLAGTLDLSLLGSGVPTPGAVYTMLRAKSFAPNQYFDQIVGMRVANGSWVPLFDSFTNGVRFSFTLLRGDMNGDQVVDDMDVEKFAWAVRDAFTYRERFINSGLIEPCATGLCGAADEYMADMDLDGDRTWADIPAFLDAVALNGGSPAAALASIVEIVQGVPEPCSVYLACGAAVVAAQRARRRRRAWSRT